MAHVDASIIELRKLRDGDKQLGAYLRERRRGKCTQDRLSARLNLYIRFLRGLEDGFYHHPFLLFMVATRLHIPLEEIYKRLTHRPASIEAIKTSTYDDDLSFIELSQRSIYIKRKRLLAARS
ncbi:MAG: hypothetical protein Q7R83_02930 [bacterium]|nr:hypothetical protein [bacterium]